MCFVLYNITVSYALHKALNSKIAQNITAQDYVIFVQLVFQAVKAKASDLEI